MHLYVINTMVRIVPFLWYRVTYLHKSFKKIKPTINFMEGMKFVFYVGVVLIAADRWSGNNMYTTYIHNVVTTYMHYNVNVICSYSFFFKSSFSEVVFTLFTQNCNSSVA